ncbi:MAG: hypothetical protein JOZ62_21025, partial [Acidobacteriaceae bacterium]|nr:hypothetical protein [Acidobacteriaceae bacterium]
SMKLNRRQIIQGGAAALAASATGNTSRAFEEQPEAGDDLIIPPPASPFEVGSKTQLMADQTLIYETRNVEFRMHPGEKHSANPILMADRPWEGWRTVLYGNVLYDSEDKLYKMWYCGEAPTYFGIGPQDSPVVTLYATSTDGIHWEKPVVGTIPSVNGTRHNAVADIELASVIKDQNEPDPARRYKMICFRARPKSFSGYHTMVSPDGLDWRALSTEPISPGGDVITGYFDERLNCYIALAKIMTQVRNHRRRVFYLITSRDFVHWTKPRLVWQPDLRDDAGSLHRIAEVRSLLSVPDNPKVMRTEFYGFGFYPAESCTIAFPWMFTINNNGRYGNQEGPGELQVGVSRDMVHWQRAFRTPIVPRGSLTDWDRGFFCTQSRALRVNDEVWLYYCGSTYTHGSAVLYRPDDPDRNTKQKAGIGIVKWKVDRFVSADGNRGDSEVITVPIVMQGDRMEVNAKVRTGGELRVTILDEKGAPLPGTESLPVRGDGVRQTVRWNTPQLARLSGRPISLRLTLKGSELYSFSFRADRQS